MNKESNTLSVALKAAKADVKEQNKQFDKKNLELEKKVVELSEYRKIKLAEEREVKLKNRKELKKERQKQKHEQETNEKNSIDKTKPEPKPSDNPANQDNSTKVDTNENHVLDVTQDDEDLTPGNVEASEQKSDETAEPKLMSEEDLDDGNGNVKLMSDKDFIEHMWKNFCGKPRPAKYTSQQESLKDKLNNGRDLDDR